MATKQKTKPTEVTVESHINMIADEQVRDDCYTLIKMMKKATGSDAKMWGPSIVGFGQYHYKYESGHEGYSCLAAFAPRKGNLVVYVMGDEKNDLLKKLGKAKATKGCLYIKRLADVDTKVLEAMVVKSVAETRKKYPTK